jgi:hypothetical protein
VSRVGSLGLLIILGAAAPTRAASCPPGLGGGATIGQVDPEIRLAWIDQHLGRTAHRARIWTWGWGIGIGASAVGDLIPVAFVAPENRIDWYTGAVTSVIGVVPLLVAPLDVIQDSRELRARLDARIATDDVCRLLADAETRLARAAANQAAGRRWWLHAGNLALNAGVGLFLGLGYHHWAAGAWNGIAGAAIGEAIILTQPTSSIDDLRSYRAGTIESPKTVAFLYDLASW